MRKSATLSGMRKSGPGFSLKSRSREPIGASSLEFDAPIITTHGQAGSDLAPAAFPIYGDIFTPSRPDDRDDAGNDVLLDGDQHAEQQREHDAVYESSGKHRTLVALQVGNGNARRDVLRRDHFSHDAAGRIGRGK